MINFTVSSRDMPVPGGWGGRGEGVGLLQEDLHHRHPVRGGGVDTEPGHVSPAFSSTVNMMMNDTKFLFRERCCVHNNTLYPVDMIIRTVDTPDNCTRACSQG